MNDYDQQTGAVRSRRGLPDNAMNPQDQGNQQPQGNAMAQGNQQGYQPTNKLRTPTEMLNFAKQHHLGSIPLWLTFGLGNWLAKKNFEVIISDFVQGEYAVASFIGRNVSSAGVDNQKMMNQAEYQQREYANQGMMNSSSLGNSELHWKNTDGYYCYVITNVGDLMYSKWKPFNHSADRMHLSQINNLTPNRRMIFGSLKFENFGDDFAYYWTTKASGNVSRLVSTYKNKFANGMNGGIPGMNQQGYPNQGMMNQQPPMGYGYYQQPPMGYGNQPQQGQGSSNNQQPPYPR